MRHHKQNPSVDQNAPRPAGDWDYEATTHPSSLNALRVLSESWRACTRGAQQRQPEVSSGGPSGERRSSTRPQELQYVSICTYEKVVGISTLGLDSHRQAPSIEQFALCAYIEVRVSQCCQNDMLGNQRCQESRGKLGNTRPPSATTNNIAITTSAADKKNPSKDQFGSIWLQHVVGSVARRTYHHNDGSNNVHDAGGGSSFLWWHWQPRSKSTLSTTPPGTARCPVASDAAR